MTETGAKSWDTSALAATSWGSGSIYGMASYQRRDEFVGDPVISSGTPLQISQLPQEDLSGFYAGIRQEAGDITFSLDASRFRRDRRARLDFPIRRAATATIEARRRAGRWAAICTGTARARLRSM